MIYVALILDMTGQYAHVYGNANSWHQFHDQLEELGCEVIEDQSNDYKSMEEIKESGVLDIDELLDNTDLVFDVV